MRTLRQLMVLLTLLAIAGQGFAAAVHLRGCPMQANEALASVASSSEAADCCDGDQNQNLPCDQKGENTPAPKPDACSVCQACFNCQSPQSVPPVHLHAVLVKPAPSFVLTNPSACLSTRGPDGLWRPPARR